MDICEAMKARHSVRSYQDKPIEKDLAEKLKVEIDSLNAEGDLHIQLVLNEPEAFGSILTHYGMFKGVKNYIAIVGKESDDLNERAGYYGEKLVLYAQMLGLNTCWVGGTFSKRKTKVHVNEGEKLVCVITLGYGLNQGSQHRNKPMEKLCKVDGKMPEWFLKGMEAAMMAPTAINQQKFLFTLTDNGVKAEALAGPFSKLDLGIVKYHFEIGAGKENFKWFE